MDKANPVVHFELPAEDMERIKKFYSGAFGWEMNQLGEDMGNYVVVMTSESDKQGPLERGRINGGFFKKAPGHDHPSVVIAVTNIFEAMKKVEAAGGKVLGGSQGKDKPDDIPGVGLYIGIVDTEGNQVALLQPKGMA